MHFPLKQGNAPPHAMFLTDQAVDKTISCLKYFLLEERKAQVDVTYLRHRTAQGHTIVETHQYLLATLSAETRKAQLDTASNHSNAERHTIDRVN